MLCNSPTGGSLVIRGLPIINAINIRIGLDTVIDAYLELEKQGVKPRIYLVGGFHAGFVGARLRMLVMHGPITVVSSGDVEREVVAIKYFERSRLEALTELQEVIRNIRGLRDKIGSMGGGEAFPNVMRVLDSAIEDLSEFDRDGESIYDGVYIIHIPLRIIDELFATFDTGTIIRYGARRLFESIDRGEIVNRENVENLCNMCKTSCMLAGADLFKVGRSVILSKYEQGEDKALPIPMGEARGFIIGASDNKIVAPSIGEILREFNC